MPVLILTSASPMAEFGLQASELAADGQGQNAGRVQL